MNSEKIKQRISAGLADAVVSIDGAGCGCQVRVVAAGFAGLTPVKRQQLVYATLQDLIASGEIHAISLKTYSPSEWEQQGG